jgi:hypothetical protein
MASSNSRNQLEVLVGDMQAHLVFVYNPALKLLIIPIMATPFLHNIVD